MCEMVGYPRESLLGQSTRILFPSDAEFERVGETLYPLLARDGVASLDIRVRRQDGEIIEGLLTSTPLERSDLSRGIVYTLLDVTQARRGQALLEARVELASVAATGDLDTLLRTTLGAAERLTQSRIGFLHLMEPDGERLSFQSWSAATLAAGCVAFEQGGHAAVSSAGVWADAVRLGEPVVHNHYAALVQRAGLPAGHVPLERELVVPVLQGGRAVAVVGVGNKPDPYTDSDRDVLVQIASMAMAGVDALRAQQSLRQHARVFESTSEGVVITDAQGRILAVNQSFLSITGYSESEVLGQNPRILSSGRHDREFYERMWASLVATGQWRGEIWNRRKSGAVYPEWLTISAVTEPDGHTSHYVAVFSDITQIKRAQERLDFLAHHDALTGLPNRLLFQDRLDHAIRRALREGRQLALLFLDLDGFKGVNDTLGHAVGDRLLEVVAERLGKRLRASDTLARLGGDEFLIVLEDDTEAAAAAAAAESCLRLLAAPARIQGHEIFISGSIGISLFPADGQDAETLLASADLAMYRAKAEGRNTFQFYVPEMTASAMERQALENALRGALARGELAVHYQAQVELATGLLCGVEALARWEHPLLGPVPPARFIPIAEGIGMVAEIDEWVLAQACGQLGAWRAMGFAVPRVSVNCSRQPLERGTLVPAVQRALESSGLAPGDLELEVTESTIMGKGPRALTALADLRALGVRLAVDDFGTGYSALGRLNRIPIDRIKIDASFIRDIGRDPKDEAVARALVGLGQDLGLEVLAEGVERADQVDLLMREGCRYAQGYLFGAPTEPAALHAAWGGGHGRAQDV
jgi:diguanylate cyclase (GGDEF)-like protein/PAS domain S-box-containing protein